MFGRGKGGILPCVMNREPEAPENIAWRAKSVALTTTYVSGRKKIDSTDAVRSAPRGNMRVSFLSVLPLPASFPGGDAPAEVNFSNSAELLWGMCVCGKLVKRRERR